VWCEIEFICKLDGCSSLFLIFFLHTVVVGSYIGGDVVVVVVVIVVDVVDMAGVTAPQRVIAFEKGRAGWGIEGGRKRVWERDRGTDRCCYCC